MDIVADSPESRAVRAAFPYLQGRAYLDTAAAGLCWDGHGAASARFFDAVKNRGIDARPEWQAMTQKVRGRLAALVGRQPADLTFVSNTTEGLNLAAHSLRLQPGEQVVLAADEFPSMVAAWEAAGAELVRVPVAHEAARAAALVQAIDADTRVLSVSHTHWGTGTTMDLRALAAACRERNVLLAVDGMQALGAVPTDLAGVDIYAASMFKWMLSGFGVGVLITSERARTSMRAAYRGYANADDPQQLQYGHVNTPAIYGLDATLDFLEGIGWQTIHSRVRALGDRLIEGAARLRLDLVTPPDQRAGLFVMRCRDGEAMRAQLAERGISVSARGAGVRISPHFYNTADEVDRCLVALAELND